MSRSILALLFEPFMRCMAWLPLRANHAVGATIGWLTWIIPNRNRTNVLVNLSLCFADLTTREQRDLAKRSLIENGKALTECGWFWFRPDSDLQAVIDFPQQAYAFNNASDGVNGKTPLGKIFITPHFGAWELTSSCFRTVERPVFLYRSPRISALEPVIRAGRERFGAELMDITGGGIKHLLRALRNGQAVGLLPDQEPARENGVFAPFFGVEANTMTLLSRIGSRTGAEIILLALLRLPKGRGYRVMCLKPFDDITNKDPLRAARALNLSVQTCISLNPAQYLWSYRRFRLLPDEGRRDYRPTEAG